LQLQFNKKEKEKERKKTQKFYCHH